MVADMIYFRVGFRVYLVEASNKNTVIQTEYLKAV